MSDPYFQTEKAHQARIFVPGFYRAWSIKDEELDTFVETLKYFYEESECYGEFPLKTHMDFPRLWENTPVRQYWVVCDMRLEEPKALLSTNHYKVAMLLSISLYLHGGNIAHVMDSLSKFLEYRDWSLDKHGKRRIND